MCTLLALHCLSPCSSLRSFSLPERTPREAIPASWPDLWSIFRTWIFVIMLFPRLHFYFFICQVDIPRMFHHHVNSARPNKFINNLIPRLASLVGSLVSIYDCHLLTHPGLKSQCHSWFLSHFHLMSNQTLSCQLSLHIVSYLSLFLSILLSLPPLSLFLFYIVTAATAVCFISSISVFPETLIYSTLSSCSIFTRMSTF